MSQNKKKGLVPKLRFSKFRDSEAWRNPFLGDIYTFKFTNSFSREKLNYEKGLVKNIHYGDIHTKFSTLFDINKELVPFINLDQEIENIKTDNYCLEGDIVFADASEDLADVGKSIELVKLNGEKLLSGLHTLLARQKANSLAIGFGGYLFRINSIRSQIQKESQGTKVLSISASRLSKIKLVVPFSLEEQEKIINCLTSIDDLITAQSKKLDTLKTQKKGLMQQLFLSEGETEPTLRFSEFENTGEWEEQSVFSFLKKISNPVKVDLGERYRQIGIRSHGKGIFHKELVSGKELGNKRVFWVKENTFVVNIVFAWEQAIANISIMEKGMIASHRFPMYEAKDNKSDVKYIKYFFLTSKGKYLLGLASPGGAGRNKTLGQKEFENLKFILPKKVEEQTKIANCLSSIDELILLHAKKLDALKTHKKGLMQQLFPTLEELTG